MDKYLKAFTHVVFLLCCLLLITNTVGAATTKNKQLSFRLPVYQAGLAIHNHDVTFDVMTAIRARSKSLWYSNTKIQYLYSGCGSLLSLGGGYRWILSPLWTIGGYAGIEGGCLPQSLGYYAKLNPGLAAHAKRGGISLNLYLPMAFGSFNAPVDESKLEKYDYTGHQARRWDYVDQNKLSCEVQGYFDILPNLKWGAGFYSANQVNNPSIVGGMTRLEYRWKNDIAAQFQYNFDNFHHHYVTFGCQFWIKDQRWGTTRLDQKLWKSPLNGHIAPIQIARHSNSEIDAHHLFFDSEVEGLEMTDATYENKCPKLNHEILQLLRVRYPLSTRKVVMHLSGFFDLADGFSKSAKTSPSLKSKESLKASLVLTPHEHLKGEISKFDVLKHLEIHLKADDLQRSSMSAETLNTLKLLACHERVIDGRAILRGAVFLNNDTSLSQVAILPARDTMPCDVNISSTDTSGEDFYRQLGAIIVQKRASKFPIQRIAVRDVIISGWPRSSKPYQYINGIDMRYCDGPELESIWINHARTGILFEDVRQTQENSLSNIYIGNFHLSPSSDRVHKFKHMLSDITKASHEEQDKEALYHANQKMLSWLSSREMNPRALFKNVENIDISSLPQSIVLKNLNVESHVSVGVDVQSSASSLNERETMDKSSEKSIQNTLSRMGQQVQATIKDFFKTQPAFPVNKPAPLKTSTLHISDGLIMAQVLSALVQDGSQLCLNHCVLSSGYLGCYVKNANLTLASNANWNSFVYIHGVPSLLGMTDISGDMNCIKDIKAKWGKKLPNVFYLEDSQKEKQKTELRNTNTSVILVAPNDHYGLNDIQSSDNQKACFLCNHGGIEPINAGSIFNVIPSSVAYFSFDEQKATQSASNLARAKQAARDRVEGVRHTRNPSKTAFFTGGKETRPLALVPQETTQVDSSTQVPKASEQSEKNGITKEAARSKPLGFRPIPVKVATVSMPDKPRPVVNIPKSSLDSRGISKSSHSPVRRKPLQNPYAQGIPPVQKHPANLGLRRPLGQNTLTSQSAHPNKNLASSAPSPKTTPSANQTIGNLGLNPKLQPTNSTDVEKEGETLKVEASNQNDHPLKSSNLMQEESYKNSKAPPLDVKIAAYDLPRI